MATFPSGTVTFLFSDLEGSTRLLHELGDGYEQVLGQHRELMRAAFARHGGVEVDTQGDAFFVAFARAADAVAAAEEAQRVSAGGPVRVRIGLHTGEPKLGREGYVGLDVHRAARICAAAHGGQVVLSARTQAAAPEHRSKDLGLHRLKDLPEPVRLFQLGDREFPPLRSLNPSNLPAQLSPLVGRQEELAEVMTLVQAHRLLTLIGPGGMGKTRLALQAAAGLVPAFPDGVFQVSLSALRDVQLVVPTIEQTLGARVPLAEHVDEKRMLLLLDNFEQVVEAAPALADTLARCPNLALLVTSRILLRISGEREYLIPPLAAADAVALFQERTMRPTPDPVAEEICRLVDGLPLAIELAAARTRVLTPDQLLVQLEQRLPLLTGGRRDAPERQRTLRATIEWSYDLLTVGEREAFRRLSVFAGGFTTRSAAEVAGVDLDLLASLAEQSMIGREDDRFTMLQTIREFAADQLGPEESASLLASHARHFLELAETMEPRLHGAEQSATLDRLDAEHGNLRLALRSSPPERRLRLAAALSWFWQLRSHLGEGLIWLGQGLNEVEARTEIRARALDGAGRLAFYRGDRTEARRQLEEGAALRQETGDARGLAQTLTYLGVAAGAAGDAETARTAGVKAVGISRTAGDDWTTALALWGLGTNHVLGRLGPPDLEAAAALLGESAELFRTTRDEWGLAAPLFYLGRIALRSGDHEAAWRLMSESAVLLRHVRDKFRLNIILHGLGDIAHTRGDEPAAAALYREALDVSRDSGQVEAIADAKIKLALTVLRQGDPAEASALLAESSTAYLACQSAEGVRWVAEGLAFVASGSGDPEHAATLLGASEARARSGGGVQLDPDDRDRLERDLRSTLGVERFETAWARGRAMKIEAAVAAALTRR